MTTHSETLSTRKCSQCYKIQGQTDISCKTVVFQGMTTAIMSLLNVTLKPDGYKLPSILSLQRSHGLQSSPLCMHQDPFSCLYPSGFCGLGADWYLQFLRLHSAEHHYFATSICRIPFILQIGFLQQQAAQLSRRPGDL